MIKMPHIGRMGSNSLTAWIYCKFIMFARDLFGDFHDHIKITKINTWKNYLGTWILNRTQATFVKRKY